MVKIDDKTRVQIFGMYINGTFVYSKGRYPNSRGDVFESSKNGNVIQCRSFLQVLVTPMERITDAHADTLEYITAENFNYHMRNKKWQLDQFEVDFLRAHGYATPCGGYSVYELVEAGIFKIKEVQS